MRATVEEMRAAVERCGSVRAAARELGVGRTTLRRALGLPGADRPAAKKAEPEPIPDHGFEPDADLFGKHTTEGGVETLDLADGRTGVRRFILTSAQNNCRVHAGFLRNLEALAKAVDAQILVAFSVYDRQGYRGPVPKGEVKTGKKRLWWDRAIEPYTCNQRARLAKRLAFCGELDIIASAADPLSGLDAYCGRSSVIVPHNKFAFRCVESRKGHLPKELYTTGSVTERKFIARKTGQLAHFHHVIGALLVEVDEDGYFWVHHLNAEEDGSFMWLDRRVEGGEVMTAPPVAAVIMGDIHHEKLDQTVADLTLREIIPALRPDTVVLHDLIDFTSRNHHNIKDPIFRVQVAKRRVRDEIAEAAAFVHRVGAACRTEVAIIQSNHDDALLRWVKETDWRTDPINAEFYLEMAAAAVRGANNPRFNLLAYALRLGAANQAANLPGRFCMIRTDESLDIKGIECGMHGHIGPSGARGSPKGFAKLGFKSFTAHTHTPSIVNGCYTVGVTGKLDMGYNHGPSKWSHTHGLIYQNGKRAFVTVKNGKWRA